MNKKISTSRLRALDEWGGGVLCFLLTVVRRMGGVFFLNRLSEVRDGRRSGVLFLKLAEQGSTVLAVDAIRDAVRRHGREKVYFLVLENNRFVLDVLGLLPEENVLEIKVGGVFAMSVSAFFCWVRVVRLRLLESVDLEFFSRLTAVFAFLSGIPRRSGFHCWYGEGPWRGDLLTHRLRYNPHLHTRESFLVLSKAFQVGVEVLPRVPFFMEEQGMGLPDFLPDEEEVAKVSAMVAEGGALKGGGIVLLNPNASDLLPLRKWDSENYISLAKRLLSLDKSLVVCFTGSPDEREAGERFARAVGSPRAFSLAGKTTLRELLALYCQADVLVTNDSGPAHFSALTPIRAVVLYGPETPELFGPLSDRATVLGGKTLCSPCVSALNHRQTRCDDNLCMRRITVDEVFFAVQNALADK